MIRLLLRAAAASLLVAGSSALADEAPVPALDVLLKPIAAGGEVAAIEIAETLSNVPADAGRPLLELPLVTVNVPTVAATLAGLEVRDDTGPLVLASRDRTAPGQTMRQWFPDRAVVGMVHVRYRVAPPSELAPLGAAPPIELKSDGGAISGGAAVSVLRPPVPRLRWRFDWDLSALGPDAVAANSLSEHPGEALPLNSLERVYFMAGRVGRHPVQRSEAGFLAVWQGEPPFDAAALMRWTETLHGEYVRFFRADRAPYTVFLRENLVNAGGGIGMERSFVTTFGRHQGSDPEQLKFTLAHEMFHTFQPTMLAPQGRGGSLSQAWFNEGLAVFYQRVLPFRAGLIDARAFLEDLNSTAARYYTSALGNAPNDEIAARFWEDTRIRTLPYDRGFLYLATVDEAMRAASRGRRSLDDLMRRMKAIEVRRGAATPSDWEQLLREELGETAVKAYHDMLAGVTPLPGSGAFGPCFRRTTKRLKRYELGFEPKALTETPRLVRGLIPGSAAAQAGLREGDEIMRPVPQDSIQGRQDGVLTLEIRREGETMTVRYVPRGEVVNAWQWEPARRTLDRHCAR